MAAYKKPSKSTALKTQDNSFAKFLSDPLIATSLIVFALIALVLSILEFSEAIKF